MTTKEYYYGYLRGLSAIQEDVKELIADPEKGGLSNSDDVFDALDQVLVLILKIKKLSSEHTIKYGRQEAVVPEFSESNSKHPISEF